MIVGNVELLARAETGGFYESLIKGTNPAAEKAGVDAGRLFGQAFVKASPPLAGALVKNGEAFVATAESQGEASGKAFSTAYIAGLERAGVATAGVFRDPAVVRNAETEGTSAGRAFATGVEGQLPLFGEEGLSAGRAFSRAFVEGTSTVDSAAAAQGADAGRAFVSGDLEQLRIGQREIVAALREQGAAIVVQSEEQGAAAGAAFSRGQRVAVEAGAAKTSALSSLSFGRIGQGAEAAGLSSGARFAGAMNKGVAIGAAALIAGTAYMAGQFQQKTNILVTAAGEDVRALGMVRKGILDIAASTGTKWQDLTDGMYQIEKAGYRGADGLKILRAAAQAAREEGANLATVTNATTSVMMSYHLGVDQAVGVTNAIKTAAGESKTTMEQFAGSLSTVLPIASANHVAFADVAGALATLTQHGTSADEATQELAFTIRNLAVPSSVASKEMAQLGLNSNDVSQMLGTKGLTGTLDFLSQTVLQKMGPSGLLLLDTFNKSKIAAQDAQTEFNALSPAAQRLAQGFKDGTVSSSDYRKESRALGGEQGVLAMQFFSTYSNAMGFQNAIKQGGPAAQTYSKAIRDMTGGANGLNTTLQITGDNLAGTEERTKRVADAFNAGGKNVQGWESTQKLFNVQMDILKQRLSAAAISMGTTFLPVIITVGKWLGVFIGGLITLQEFAVKHVGPAFHDLADQIGAFGRALKPVWDAFRDSPLFKPALVLALAAIVGPILIVEGALKSLAFVFRDIVNPIARFVSLIVSEPGRAFDLFKRAAGDAVGAVVGFFKRLPDEIPKALGAAFDFGTMLGHAWGRLIADVPHWIGDLIAILTHVDWGHVASVIGDALMGGIKAIWRNKAKVAEVTGAIVGLLFAAAAAVPLLVVAVGASIAFGIVKGIVQGLAPAAGAVGRFFERMWHDVSGFASRMAGDVGRFFSRMWHDVAGFASRIWRDVSGFFSRMAHDVAGAVGSVVDFIGRHWRLLIVIFLGPIGFVIDLVNRFWRQISGFFARLWRDVSGFAARIWSDVTGFFSRMWRDVSGFAVRMWRDVSGFASRMWRDAAGFAFRLWHDVAGFFFRMWADVSGFAARIWRDVAGFFSRMWRDVTGFASRIWHDVSGFFSNLWHDLTDFAGRIWRDVTGLFNRLRDDLSRTANDLWHKVKAPFVSLWGDLKAGFDDVVRGIDAAWRKLGNIFRTPINFLIRYVYDDGIVKVWNFVMDVVGENKKLGPIGEIKPFAAGGGTAGPWRGDDRLIKVGGNEHVWTAEEVNAAGGHERVAALRSQALGGRPVRVMGEGPGSGYLFGGGVDWIKDKGKALAGGAVDVAKAVGHDLLHPSEILPDIQNAVRGALAATADPILNGAVGLLGKLLPGNSTIERTTVGMGHAMVGKVLDWIRSQDAKDLAAMAAMGGNDGTSAPLIIEYARRHGIHVGPVTTTGGKHVNGSYHYLGEAVDFGNVGNPDQRGIFNVFDAVAPSLLELFWDPAGHYVKNGQRIPGAIGGHGDHVHVAAGLAAMQQLLGIVPTGGPAGEGGLRSYAQSRLNAHGWGSQFGLLDYIINHESNWDVHAANSSGAYGIPQALPGSKMASAGPDWHDNGATQLHWMIDQYIPSRYHTLQAAYDFKRRTGVYDRGGYLMPGANGMPGATLAINNTGRKERVLDADETEAYEAGQRTAGGRRAVQVTQTNHIHGVDQPTAERLAARRLGLALQGAGVSG